MRRFSALVALVLLTSACSNEKASEEISLNQAGYKDAKTTEINEKIAKFCLKAQDFAGCVQTMTQKEVPFKQKRDYVIPGIESFDSPPRFIRPRKKNCDGVAVQLISNSPQFIIDSPARLYVTPAEVLLTFDNGESIREMGLFAGWGNWSGFESKNVKMGRSTGGYSVHFKDKRICGYDKYD